MCNIKKKDIIVSVIIPVRNEEKYIDKCIKSIINQDYPLKNIEVIFVDGLSQDNTREIILSYISEYPQIIKLLKNEHKTVPFAMNIGIHDSVGKYIMRLDAHSEYPSNYISKCVYTIEKTNADNVGGLAVTKGKGYIGEAFSKVLSSKFGVGDSGFRTNVSSGYVDTVPFGTFKRTVFEKYGFYDERLIRNQDYELNYRIRKNGGNIYLNSEISLIYYCRNTIRGIIKQSYGNGKWNVFTCRLCPGSMSLRHFIPLLFVMSIVLLSVLSFFYGIFEYVFILEMVLYFILDIVFSVNMATNVIQFLLLLILYPIFHISYGIGSIIGIFKLTQTNYN